ncbi:hypothetical protein PYCCODRAFT_1469245 [Trametes coccinea BRFM310]|uniref:Uncharacterized protein n=1 Tax=Trametes coccinea (strain BRFM310) TaxID=1353009 RepID=A0A1Y2IHH9_TRAC3|nr:hypothetical protein PYCCODRAFT_1469245 [Trametes coccinea BRFM310]
MSTPSHTSPPPYPLTQLPRPPTPLRDAEMLQWDGAERNAVWPGTDVSARTSVWLERFKNLEAETVVTSEPAAKASTNDRAKQETSAYSPLPPSSVDEGSDSPGDFGQEASRGNGLSDILVDTPEPDEPMKDVELGSIQAGTPQGTDRVTPVRPQPMRIDLSSEESGRTRKRQRVRSPDEEYDPRQACAHPIPTMQPALPLEVLPIPPQPVVVNVGPLPSTASYVRPVVVRSTTGEPGGPEILTQLVDAVANQVIQAAIGIATGTDATLTAISANEVDSTSSFLEQIIIRLRGDVEILERIANSKRNEEEQRKLVAMWTQKFDTSTNAEPWMSQNRERGSSAAEGTPSHHRDQTVRGPGLDGSIHAPKRAVAGWDAGLAWEKARGKEEVQDGKTMRTGVKDVEDRSVKPAPRASGLNGLARMAANQRGMPSPQATNTPVTAAAHKQVTSATPKPPRGFPTVHTGDSRDRVRNVDQRELEDWESKEEGTKLVLEVFGEVKRTQGSLQDMSSRIRSLLRKVAGAEDFAMTGPKPENETEVYLIEEARTAWLLSDLKKDVAAFLIELNVISTKPITIIVHKRAIETPRFICSLRGLDGIPSEDLREAIRQLLREEMNVASIKNLIENDKVTRPKTRDPLARAKYLVETIDVTRHRTEVNGKWQVIANLYMDRPTADEDQWDAWRDRMVAKYLNDLNYIHYCYVGRCAGCHGVDHGTADCPFGRVSGWNGRVRNTMLRFENDELESTRPVKARGFGARLKPVMKTSKPGHSENDMRWEGDHAPLGMRRKPSISKMKGKARE